MPYGEIKGLLTDIGTEELAHFEMISAILYQLTKNLTIDEIKKSGFDTYFVDRAKKLLDLIENAMGKKIADRTAENTVEQFGSGLA